MNDVARPWSVLKLNRWEPRDLRGVPRAVTDARVLLDTNVSAGLADVLLQHEPSGALHLDLPGCGKSLRIAELISAFRLGCTDVLPRISDPATWNCGPRVNIRGSARTLYLQVKYVEAAPGTWPQAGAVVGQASIALGATSEFLYDNTAPVPTPTGGPDAQVSPSSTVWHFSREQLSARLWELANAVRLVLLANCLCYLRQLAFPARQSSAMLVFLHLLAVCRRYGRRAEPSHVHTSRSRHQLSAGCALVAY